MRLFTVPLMRRASYKPPNVSGKQRVSVYEDIYCVYISFTFFYAHLPMSTYDTYAYTNNWVHFVLTNVGIFIYVHIRISLYFHIAMRTKTPTEAMLCCSLETPATPPAWDSVESVSCRQHPWQRRGGAGGSVGDAVGAPTGAATAARVRFCLSGGIRHWEVYKQLFRICAVYVRIFHWQNFGSLYIQVEYVLIRTYTYMYVYRTYSVCIRTYIVRISYVYVRILALYVRYTYVYERYTYDIRAYTFVYV